MIRYGGTDLFKAFAGNLNQTCQRKVKDESRSRSNEMRDRGHVCQDLP